MIQVALDPVNPVQIVSLSTQQLLMLYADTIAATLRVVRGFELAAGEHNDREQLMLMRWGALCLTVLLESIDYQESTFTVIDENGHPAEDDEAEGVIDEP